VGSASVIAKSLSTLLKETNLVANVFSRFHLHQIQQPAHRFSGGQLFGHNDGRVFAPFLNPAVVQPD
jgi:hypothetical protein